MGFNEFALTFLAPVGVILAIAAALAFLLSYLGKRLQVERDPRIDEVLNNLAGANCGGCGYPGCDAFATALVEGKAKLDACNPTSKEGKDVIAGLLGVKNDGVETVAVVRCNGGNACNDKSSYQGYGSCTTAELLAHGSKACPVGCMGLGSCTLVCNYDAITIKSSDGYAQVQPSNCVSCGSCLAVCPKRLIGRIPKTAQIYVACSNECKGRDVMAVCKRGCIACGKCAKACPTGAIVMTEKNLPSIDYSKCTACKACAEVCPTKVIKYKATLCDPGRGLSAPKAEAQAE